MRYSVIEHPQFSERSTRRFFSSAVNRKVTVDHFPEALFGFLPLGFRPLTAPLPTVHHGLCLLHGVVATAFHHVQHWWEPTTVTRSCPHVLTVKQGSVKPTAGRALVFPPHNHIVHGQNLPQISFDPEPARRERKSENLFFAGSFQILEILSPGDKLRLVIICRVSAHQSQGVRGIRIGSLSNLPTGNFHSLWITLWVVIHHRQW